MENEFTRGREKINFFKRKAINGNNREIREVLFGDRDIEQWCGEGIPWELFSKAKEEITIGNNNSAIETLKEILKIDGLESRHYIQAWYFLRKLGVMPDENIGSKVYGVVIEVALDNGLDILAAYTDYSARYFNYSGAAVIWEKPDDTLNESISNLISISQAVVNNIGPWDKVRPKPPAKGNVRLNFLTPLGLHFGEGPFNLLSKDPMGGPVIAAGTDLMLKLIEKSKEK